MKRCVDQVLKWYLENRRDLPWRVDTDPYHIWISEVMLQQTRIESVIDYYLRFLKEVPTIFVLATIDDEKLLKLWEGLGYYSRARNLKKTASIIVSKYAGIFPTTYAELITLPGIGDYTASAISSICFQEKKATVDGNVLRVYTRFFGDYSNISDLKVRRRIAGELEAILPKESGIFNQALMEIGEVVCIPKGVPNCLLCPLNEYCISSKKCIYLELPVKNLKKDKKIVEYTVLIFKCDDQYAIQKRKNKGLLHQLWQFPNLEGTYTSKQIEDYLIKKYIVYRSVKKFTESTHVFTHQKWKMISYYIEIDHFLTDSSFVFKSLDIIRNDYAIPTAFQPFLRDLSFV